MNHKSIQNSIGQLSATPNLLRELLSAMDPMKVRTKPAPGLFSPLESSSLRVSEHSGARVGPDW
jgi:hypothetical protein